MKKITLFFQKNPLAILLGIFGFAQVFALCIPAIISWDGSVYAGMARYIYSGGEVGVFEVLRPVGLPVLLGLFWKLGIDPYEAARFIVLVSSLFSLVLVYRIANLIQRGSGLYAGLVLAFTPLFFRFSTIPMTDVLSTTLALGSIYFSVQYTKCKGYVLSGVFAGLAFLFRFPHGLILVVSGVVVLLQSWQEHKGFVQVFKNSLGYLLGFSILAIPFFLVNTYMYADALLPLRAGAGIIAHNPILYREHPLFYFISLLRANYLHLFAIVPLVLIFIKKEYRYKNALWATVLFLLIYIGYFSITEHKEFRYTLGFLPAATILAGVGIYQALSIVRNRKIRYALVVVVALGALYIFSGVITEIPRKNDYIYEQIGEYFNQYERATGTYARVLTAVPFVVSNSSAKIVDTLYDDWRIVLPLYEKHRGDITHVLTDTCTLEVICRYDAGCTNGKQEFENRIKNESTLVQSGNVGSCRVMLYEVK